MASFSSLVVLVEGEWGAEPAPSFALCLMIFCLTEQRQGRCVEPEVQGRLLACSPVSWGLGTWLALDAWKKLCPLAEHLPLGGLREWGSRGGHLMQLCVKSYKEKNQQGMY